MIALGSLRNFRNSDLRATVAILLTLIGFASGQSSAPTFEVASIKPGTSNARPRVKFRAWKVDHRWRDFIGSDRNAYGIQPFELVRMDSPVLGERFDITAKAPGPATAAECSGCCHPFLRNDSNSRSIGKSVTRTCLY